MAQMPTEDMIQTAPVETLPLMIGELSRLQAMAYARLANCVPKIAPPDSENLLSVPQVAARLNLPRSRVYELARKRDGLPTIKIGKYLRFSPLALQNWLMQRPSR